MTSAPPNLLAARAVLLDQLGRDARPAPGVTLLDRLDGAELGIVGDPNHRGGYHCGSDRVVDDDYSVHESPRDLRGLTRYACALDVGKFRVRTAIGTYDLPHYSRWLVAQCAANTADTQHIREVIYSPDGKVVRRWDRLHRRTTGDTSHLFHTHESYFRDAVKSGRDVSAVKRRYLRTIGVIPTPPPEVPDMDLDDKITGTDNPNRTVGNVLADLANLRNALVTPVGQYDGPGAPAPGSPVLLLGQLVDQVAALGARVEQIRVKLDELGGSNAG